RQLAAEVERVRAEAGGGRRRGVAEAATERLFAAAPATVEVAEPEARPPVVGGRVRRRTLGWEGLLEKLDRGRAEVTVGGKRLRCREDELVGIGDAAPRRPRPEARVPERESAPAELMLLGERVENALERLDGYLDEALLAGREEVRVIHGHGTGKLRQAVREHLRSHPAVATFRAGEEGEGGNGATVVRLRG